MSEASKTAAKQRNKAAEPVERKAGSLGLYFLAVGLALILAIPLLYWGVTPIVRAEYGRGLPSIEAFCAHEEASYTPQESWLEKGTHPLILWAGNRYVPCLLVVQDTEAPQAQPAPISFPSGYLPSPDEFITDLEDADLVGVRFGADYDFSAPGQHDVTILLEDMSGNRSEVQSTATVWATVEAVIREAGSPAPGAEAFCQEGFHGTLLDPITETMMATPGEYDLQLVCQENGKVFSSRLVIRDTVPPQAQGKLAIMKPGEDCPPEACLLEIQDVTSLRYSFLTAPDPTSREIQDVIVQVTDAGGNCLDVPAQVLFSSFSPSQMEARKEPLTAADLHADGILAEAFIPDTPGHYVIRVQTGAEVELAPLEVVDTTAPALSLLEGPFYTLHPLSPEDLIRAEDVSPVSLEYVREPDWTRTGDQAFQVKAIDAFGNETLADFTLSLNQDTTPPTLFGAVDRIGYVNEPIVYLRETYAEDDVDGRVEVSVSSQVVLSQKGKYSVTYTATDLSGNTTSKTCTFTLVKPTVSQEELDEAIDKVIASIITPDMVPAEQLKAVFDYVQSHVRYVGNSDKTDWRKEAMRALKQGKGDCFTFYSLTRALLTKLDIPYMSVTRKGGATRHYWLIVNIGTGWYHFDTLKNYYQPRKCFMWTNEQLKVMPAVFWRFAEENFPPIATEPFDYAAVVQMEKEGLLP